MTRQCTILEPGMFTTVQDLGRFGHASRGVTTSGAMDAHSAILANRLVSNSDNTALLEMTLLGGTFTFNTPTTIAITGALASLTRKSPLASGSELPHARPCTLNPGETLSIARAHTGARLYLAVDGGFDLPTILGSRSTNLIGAFGGFSGRHLKSGDILPLSSLTPSRPPPLLTSPGPLDAHCAALLATRTLRCLPGPQHHDFPHPALFWSSTFKVSNRSDRMGLRLEGDPLESPFQGRLPSQCTPHGAIQVPPEGLPIILGADHPTTGGYPVIAAIASVDLPILGQLRPGDDIRFERITLADSLRLLAERMQLLDRLLPPRSATLTE
jgi:antagonist of KipI